MFLLGYCIGVFLFIVTQIYMVHKYYVKPRETRRLPDYVYPDRSPYTEDYVKEMKTAEKNAKPERCMWLNVILARLWSELRDREAFATGFANLIHEEVIDLKREPFGIYLGEVSELKLLDIDLGESIPTVDNIAVLPPKNADRSPLAEKNDEWVAVEKGDENAELRVSFDMAYQGGIAFTVEIPTSLNITVTIFTRLKELSGRMFLQFEKSPHSTFSFGFFESPKMVVEVKTLINGTEFAFFNDIVKSKIFSVMEEKLVLPNHRTKWFMKHPQQPPYPWQLKEGQDESYLYSWTPSEPQPMSPPLSPEPSMKIPLMKASSDPAMLPEAQIGEGSDDQDWSTQFELPEPVEPSDCGEEYDARYIRSFSRRSKKEATFRVKSL